MSTKSKQEFLKKKASKKEAFALHGAGFALESA